VGRNTGCMVARPLTCLDTGRRHPRIWLPFGGYRRTRRGKIRRRVRFGQRCATSPVRMASRPSPATTSWWRAGWCLRSPKEASEFPRCLRSELRRCPCMNARWNSDPSATFTNELINPIGGVSIHEGVALQWLVGCDLVQRMAVDRILALPIQVTNP
jgi:hypothetical protein